MTVRWKPLLLLSGLFLVVGIGSLLTFAMLTGADPAELVTKARAERDAGRLAAAEIHYRRALQATPEDAALDLELADLYARWASEATSDQRPPLLLNERKALADAQKHDRKAIAPRQRLLGLALAEGQHAEAVALAKELIALEPNSSDAHYVLGIDALEASPPDRNAAALHLKALEAEPTRRPRTDWLAARSIGDTPGLPAKLAEVRTRPYPDARDASDQLAALKLRALDAQTATELTTLLERGAPVLAAARGAELAARTVPGLHQIHLILQDVQARLQAHSQGAEAPAVAQAEAMVAEADKVAEATVAAALAASAEPDLRIYQIQAEHLLNREQPHRAIEVIEAALRTPTADDALMLRTTLALRDLAVRAALSEAADPGRFDRAAPHIEALLAKAEEPYFHALGSLYQGAIDLERSGLADGQTPAQGVDPAALRDLAVGRLKKAADGLPKMSTAQALYGVSLMLAGEPALGRQYLQTAQALGSLDARYQVWAAWSMIQAGYPEEAERIAALLEAEVRAGNAPESALATIRLIQGEAAQATRTPDDLRRALARFEEARQAGQPETPALLLRKAQIQILLGQTDQGLAILDGLRKAGQGGPGVEHLAILTHAEQGRIAEAAGMLKEARAKYPDDVNLAVLQAQTLAREEKPAEADALLKTFADRHPNEATIAEERARLLAGPLNRPDEARAVLDAVAERTNSTGPLVALATLALAAKDEAAVERTIARIRERWPQAAAADLIEAQLALARDDLNAAAAKMADVLRKDPSNKLALFWKAQLDAATGHAEQSTQALESLAQGGTSKQVEPGLNLAQAAESTLASLAMRDGDLDGAIKRIQSLIAESQGQGPLARRARWQLAEAYAAKGEFKSAEEQLKTILDDKAAPPDHAEKIRAANLYRRQPGRDRDALALLAEVLKDKPDHAPAAILSALVHHEAGRNPEGIATIRSALTASQTPPADLFLVLAAFESESGTEETRQARALAALADGLKRHPDQLTLVEANYKLLKAAEGDAAALTFAESTAPRGEPFKRLLVDVYRDQGRLEQADAAIGELLTAHPDERGLWLTRARIRVAMALKAGADARTDGPALAWLEQSVAKFPTNPADFHDLRCELAIRRGDRAAAVEATRAMDLADAASPAGALRRAQISALAGDRRESAQALAEAIGRAPGRTDLRLRLAELRLSLGEFEQAIAEADQALQRRPGLPAATLIKCRALADRPGSPSQRVTWRDQAADALKETLARDPKLVEAYLTLADLRIRQDRRADAITTLRAGLQRNPDDPSLIAALVQRLAEPRPGGSPALAEADALAKQVGTTDATGAIASALAIGFGKADQLDRALPWAEEAAERSKAPGVLLNRGGLLMAKAERTADPAAARVLFDRAAQSYDQVLEVQADSIEAVNNKAWILHKHLGRDDEALKVARDLMGRADPRRLPAEFFDTLGVIEEATGDRAAAEKTYAIGLQQEPDAPGLNYRLGRLLAADGTRADRAMMYLRKAEARIAELTPEQAGELKQQLARLTP